MKRLTLPLSQTGFRLLGLGLLFIAYAAGKKLLAVSVGHQADARPIAYMLAMIAFLSASMGCALFVHGHHLFDQVEVSERWRSPSPSHVRDDIENVAIGQKRETESAVVIVSSGIPETGAEHVFKRTSSFQS